MASRTSSSATTAPVVPDFLSRESGLTYPTVEPSPPFLLVHYPTRYSVIAGRLVPSPSKVPLVSGVNRVVITEKGRIHFADTAARISDRGGVVIPYEKGPNGESYLRAVDTRPSGQRDVRVAHLTAWESVFPGEARTVVDEDGYSKWLAELVKAGVLPDCPPHVAQRMLEQAQAALADAEDKASRGKLSDSARLVALRKQVEVLTASIKPSKPARGAAVTPELG